MSSVQERLQLKRVPLDTWSIREQLCLASAVVMSGDQNWMSVSRALKTIGEANRPQDWYSQKSCAAQYGVLLENVETPKRKKRSSESAVETPQESILKKLTQERIVEIQKTLAEMNQQYDQLKSEVNEIRNPSTTDDRLRELWAGVEAAKRAREREAAKRAAWLKEREEKRARAEKTWRPPTQTPASSESPPSSAGMATPSSPLLTSLLKSSPVVTTPQHISHPANVVDSVSPSAGAPTLSMLLEAPRPATPSASIIAAPIFPAPNISSPTIAAPTIPAPADNKHAAIEHIKSQLVQIEKSLKATSQNARPVASSAALDIDDIEIKDEDVYAFRDIDYNNVPLTSHTVHRTPEKQESTKKDSDVELPPVPMEVSQDDIVQEAQIKEEPIIVEVPPPEVTQEEQVPEVIPIQEEVKPEVSEPTPEVKISFPESSIKFPTTEIKVIQPDEQKIKEELKETDSTPTLPDTETDQEINVEDISEENIQNNESQPEEATLPSDNTQTSNLTSETQTNVTDETEVQTAPSVDEKSEVVKEDAALPSDSVEDVESQVTAEPEAPPPPPVEPEPESEPTESNKEPHPAEESKETTTTEVETTTTEEEKKEDSEDSLPLKEMIKEEAKDPEIKEEKREAEENHNETDDDAPMELSREEEKDGKKKRDYSRKKKSDSRTGSGSESADASAPESPGADADRAHRLWRKSVMLVYSRLCAHKYASIFSRPISDDEAPGYSAAVRRPTDLNTIRRHIDNGTIRTTGQFHRDVMLMLTNALMYNCTAHSVHAMARDMFNEAQSECDMLVAAQAHAGLCQPPPARKRRAL